MYFILFYPPVDISEPSQTHLFDFVFKLLNLSCPLNLNIFCSATCFFFTVIISKPLFKMCLQYSNFHSFFKKYFGIVF